MCTVTFVPRQTGYLLAMNRDERLARDAGLPPREETIRGHRVLYPSEPGGGTWIAVNEDRVSFALINWYSVTARVKANPVSRGEVVKVVSAFATAEPADDLLRELPLNRINPFRLIGIFPARRQIMEWQWDLKTLNQEQYKWKAQQWISSGFDEPAAQRCRGEVFRIAEQQRSAGSPGWLRRLHRSHSPESGPFSTCMHRDDAATVSYSEISASRNCIRMRYHRGPPCNTETGSVQSTVLS